MTAMHHRPPTRAENRSTMVRWLASRGISLFGAQNLTVVGRVSGTPRTVPVNPLLVDGREYVLSVRGSGEWVRNARAAGRVALSRGRRSRDLAAREVDVDERVPVIAEYLRRWGWEVRRFLPEGFTDLDDVGQLAAHAEQIPVFELIEDVPDLPDSSGRQVRSS